MRAVARLVLGLCDVAEAEGRLLRESVWRTGLGCALAVVGVFFLGGCCVLLVMAAYQVLCALLPVVLVQLILGALCATTAFGFLWSARKCLPDSKPQTPVRVPGGGGDRVAQ